MTPSPISNKRIGIVLGFLIGDSLGAPFRAVKGGHIYQLVGDRVDGYLADPVLFPERPEKNYLPGLHTILGQELLAVLAGAADDGTGRPPLARAGALLADLAGEGAEGPSTLGALRQPGRPLRRGVQRWRAEYPWELADHFAPDESAEGATPAARALAAALLPDTSAIDAARLTHLREAPLSAAVALAETARLLLDEENPKKIDASAVLDHVIGACREAEDALREGPVAARWKELAWGFPVVRFSECLSPVASLLRTADDALAEKTLLHQVREFVPTTGVTHVQHGFAPVLVPWVLYRALGTLAPAPAIEDAVNRGGETSLAAGLIGALMGARYGADHLPEEWTEGCRAAAIARTLALAPSTAAEEAWLADERRWTGEEETFRAPLRREAEKRNAESTPRKKPKKPAAPPVVDQGSLPFAPPPQAWLEQKGDELAPWEKQRLKAERGRKRIDWKETRRQKSKHEGGGGEEEP
ncbi:MAG: hypothetical protein PWP23_867 [Candidatus Sumerlaeota bacterium]|nr:hypothetical protein [Candidatus Sumerlaeota bacterium]